MTADNQNRNESTRDREAELQSADTEFTGEKMPEISVLYFAVLCAV